MLGPISGLSAVARRRHGSRGGESRSFGALLEGPSSARPRYPSRHFSPSSSPRPHRRSQRGWTTSWWPPSRASACQLAVQAERVRASRSSTIASYIWAPRAASAGLWQGFLRSDQRNWTLKISMTLTSRRPGPS